jgi:hypothetical protein
VSTPVPNFSRRKYAGDLDANTVRELLIYDPKNGALYWRVSICGIFRIGPCADMPSSRQYRRIKILGTEYFTHRVVWVYVHGKWPVQEIDHINGIKDDNRICNLREATREINMQNMRKAAKTSTHGYMGVSRSLEKWQSRIRINGIAKYLGTFDTPEAAHGAYIAAKRTHHPGCTI